MSSIRSDGGYQLSSSSAKPSQMGFEDGGGESNKPPHGDVAVEYKTDNLPVADGKGEGNAHLEEGEIQDSPEPINQYVCRYYQKGYCTYGKDCGFFHLSDKGLYSMLDFPAAVAEDLQSVQEKKCVFVNPPPFEDIETAWDRALKDAKERIKASKKIRAVAHQDLRLTILRRQKMLLKKKPILPPGSECSLKKVPSRAVTHDKSKSTERNPPSTTAYRLDSRVSLKRAKTPSNMRWSPKSSSRSRSCSHSSCEKSSCSCSKLGCRVSPPLYSKRYRRPYSSSNSESSSTSPVSEKVSRHFIKADRSSSSRHKMSKIPNRRSPKKALSPRKLERKNSRTSWREIPRRPTSFKHPVNRKVMSLRLKNCNKSYSDMSISPASDSSLSGKNDLRGDPPVFRDFSDRRVRDMSISPLSDASSPDFFPGKAERIDPKISKLSTAQNKGSSSVMELKKSNPVGSISRGKSATGTHVKKSDPLLFDLMKFHRGGRQEDFRKGTKNVPSKTSSDRPTDPRLAGKVKQKAESDRGRLSKKEILLQRLEAINDAIRRRKNVYDIGKEINVAIQTLCKGDSPPVRKFQK